MAVKLIVTYPRPKDIQAFETVYEGEHVPLAVENLVGKTKLVATKVLGSPTGKPAFHRIERFIFDPLGRGDMRGFRGRQTDALRMLSRSPLVALQFSNS